MGQDADAPERRFREPHAALDQIARRVVDAALEVHRVLGPGYLEAVYEPALARELSARAIPFEQQHPFQIQYKGEIVGEGRVDFLIAGALVVELKSVDRLAPVHKPQVISYLRATGAELALLVNFNERLLKEGIQRVVLT